MNIIEVILMIVVIFASLALIAAVLLQPSRSAGVSGVIGGGMETFFGKNKAKSYEGKLLLGTKISATVVFLASFAMVLIARYW